MHGDHGDDTRPGAPGGTVTKLSSRGTVLGTFMTRSSPRGAGVNTSGDVWIGDFGTISSPGNTLPALSPAGMLLNTHIVGNNPTGVAIDSAGNVWVANYGSDTITVLKGASTPGFRAYTGPVWP